MERKVLHEVIKEYVIHALILHNWRVQEAAKYLGISRATLYRKIIEYDLKRREHTDE